MWRDVASNGKVEVVELLGARAKESRQVVQGCGGRSDLHAQRSRRHVLALLSPGGPQDYWRHARSTSLGEAARFSVDEKFRGQAYKEMTRIFLEHLPWIPVIQPYEDYGLRSPRVDTEPQPGVRDPPLRVQVPTRLDAGRPGLGLRPHPCVPRHLPRRACRPGPRRRLARLHRRLRRHAAVGRSGAAPAAPDAPRSEYAARGEGARHRPPAARAVTRCSSVTSPRPTSDARSTSAKRPCRWPWATCRRRPSSG